MPKRIALAADFHLDGKRANLFGNKMDPETGLSTFCLMRLSAFEEYLELISGYTKTIIFLGDLFNPNVDERIKKTVFRLIARYMDEVYIIIGNHEFTRFYHTYSSYKEFDLKGCKLHIIDKVCVKKFLGHKIAMVPWGNVKWAKGQKDIDYVMAHADPVDCPKNDNLKYILGHIHQYENTNLHFQLGVQFPVISGEKSNGQLIFLTKKGICSEPMPMLFDIIRVESQDDIDSHDHKRTCYVVDANKVDDYKIPKKAIYYYYFKSKDEAEEMNIGDVSNLNVAKKKDIKKWMSQEGVPGKIRKAVMKRIRKVVGEVVR